MRGCRLDKTKVGTHKNTFLLIITKIIFGLIATTGTSIPHTISLLFANLLVLRPLLGS
ncbi:hypothetical protein QE357_000736 [Siphonobacter sp. BAB-5404]|nr:hypothetical protein [Siphonobacter sp. SORGH_AS_0500]